MAQTQKIKAPASKAPPTPASKAPPKPPSKDARSDLGTLADEIMRPSGGKAPPPPKAAAPSNGAASAPPAPSQGTAAHAPPADKAGDAIKALIAKQGEQIKALSLAIDAIKQNGARPDPVDVTALYAEGSPAYKLVSEADSEDPRLPWHGMRVRTVFFDNIVDKKTGMWSIVRHDNRRTVGTLAIPDDNDPGGKGTIARNNGQLAFYYNFRADGKHEGPPLYCYPDELTDGIVLQWHDGAAWQDYG